MDLANDVEHMLLAPWKREILPKWTHVVPPIWGWRTPSKFALENPNFYGSSLFDIHITYYGQNCQLSKICGMTVTLIQKNESKFSSAPPPLEGRQMKAMLKCQADLAMWSNWLHIFTEWIYILMLEVPENGLWRLEHLGVEPLCGASLPKSGQLGHLGSVHIKAPATWRTENGANGPRGAPCLSTYPTWAHLAVFQVKT